MNVYTITQFDENLSDAEESLWYLTFTKLLDAQTVVEDTILAQRRGNSDFTYHEPFAWTYVGHGNMWVLDNTDDNDTTYYIAETTLRGE
jgi:hypothetical protein